MNDPQSTPETGEEDARLSERFEQLDDILDDIRERHGVAPQWEFCAGFMAALLCCRREIPLDEYLPLLLGDGEPDEPHDPADSGGAPELFADAAQRKQFLRLWTERWLEVQTALDAEVELLDDPRAYSPQLVDMRGLAAQLPPEERASIDEADLPAFGQLWALGFIDAVECWPQEWEPPRDKETRLLIEDAIESIDELTQDDTDPPDISPYDETDPPSVSAKRFAAFGEALWAVYDLHDIWRSLGPRIEPVRKAATPGRNDPCPCGSGKKFKKCHGA